MKRALIIVVIMLSAAGMIGCGSYTSLQSPQKSQQKSPAMTVSDVITLSQANTGDDIIIAQIQATHTVFALSNQDIIDLKNANVSEKVIAAMIKTNAATKKDSTYARYWYPRDYWWYSGYYWPGYYSYWPGYYWYPGVYLGGTIYLGNSHGGGHFSGGHGRRSFGRR